MSIRTRAVGILVLTVAACSSGGSGSVEVSDGWARPSPPTAVNAAFYLQIDNGGSEPDRLAGASSNRCATSELHMSDMNDGVMTMAPAESADLAVPAGGRLVLEPGGLHVMCIGLDEPLTEGETIDLELTFESGDVVEAEISVADR